MRIHTSVGITPTILVIVVTIGDGRRLGAGGPCAALRARSARAESTGVNGIATTGATAPRRTRPGLYASWRRGCGHAEDPARHAASGR
jgi:hypothetical protein